MRRQLLASSNAAVCWESPGLVSQWVVVKARVRKTIMKCEENLSCWRREELMYSGGIPH